MTNELFADIAPAMVLGIALNSWDGHRVELTAPLDPNLNDKGTAFAGSIDSLLDLAGWSAITLALREVSIDAAVMIVKSATDYRSAVRADMKAVAEIPELELERLKKELRERGRSRMPLQSHLFSNGIECASMAAHYAVIAKS